MRLAAIQYCAGADVQENLREAGARIAEAVEGGARLVVLPENFACYGGDYRALAGHGIETVTEWLATQAREQAVWLLGGSLPLAVRPDGEPVPAPRVRAASLLVGPDGTLRARYDKLHLFDALVPDAQGSYCESRQFEPGDRLVTAQVDQFTLGMAVCYDLRFPSLARALADHGSDLLVYPSAFTAVTGAAHWELLLRARAVETGCYVLGVNQCGQHSERRASYGHSMLVDPWGRVQATLADRPGVLLGEVLRNEIDDVRHRLPVHTHQRLLTGLPDDIRDN
ncbi:carbon-nitrogen hydrolase family protein [Alcanivorax sp. S71-1-4]|uniref:carbon-nitrogen hydrolase family protein n=1 Tax=Alcanivorax sp. S71-1-4 TaxID=1177159 RepID=UPI00135AF677|nr:carbon-nitrogen hydrolase family protein [Alcanivorax sp. S71-1-4]KAF0809274.1 carbon-nitrogen hydrolase family protein [Alcanivorax sp. S71-1-4]